MAICTSSTALIAGSEWHVLCERCNTLYVLCAWSLSDLGQVRGSHLALWLSVVLFWPPETGRPLRSQQCVGVRVPIVPSALTCLHVVGASEVDYNASIIHQSYMCINRSTNTRKLVYTRTWPNQNTQAAKETSKYNLYVR